MIATLKGVLEQKTPNAIIIDVNGVGYHVLIPLSTFYMLPKEKEKVFMEIHTHVREDAISLFGFFTFEEKVLFEHLIGVTKIGPKLAINILSGIGSSDLKKAIVASDFATLSNVPGVGRKTAERLVYELREKMQLLPLDKKQVAEGKVSAGNHIVDDVISALTNLGYSKIEAEEAANKAFKRCDTSGESVAVEEVLKESLKAMAKHI
ncbi:MAG: Holliday junction DNA helicase RuvA [Candidatus Schekmanbacteria bacterium RIFCSPHIGHO2_02_FULL_38_11]|uniref:Holliday junction branch migration complex subunit RuvA n=1 Tax=Candidatus Schekmanbacteria bacterium RIFCSPLOWO2_12_FULL_38_15 TaxID=1817883 RepID=A0A1F7SIT9_9BACT|nr:MAG: Holliday junction DNA helicase RuvA [Candidatus Schekmanbacteria bacterium GWA2_38_9]OGL49245.1 MAG: Holliday junction DNA helicase RuvA [Candidatus Schekmanbacteria bacterium RIFCSPLOWO2_02_FULL_38_14]OGL53700.1 MAG: Holliday junction DNA helicase RuvA [Candidatus Schekmanbacteria bacterium RIFCSPLOWO2_12_FULL_38_15]OGL54719.1 MAG: Holliday junction DNA helicase RuvA [Candidatus Schekmanbacteria bacterium RIFCSPHIGHO2_02_FULL_38_11]